MYSKVLSDRNSTLYMRGSRGGGEGVQTSLKNHKNIGFLSNTGPDPLKNQSYQARFNVGTLACQRNAISRAFPWQADNGPLIVVFGSSLSSSTKKKPPKNVF